MSDEPKKYCTNCGKEIPHNVTFCPYCGTQQMDDNMTNNRPHNSQMLASTTEIKKSSNPISALKLSILDAFTISKRMARADFWWLYLDLTILGLIMSPLLTALLHNIYSYGYRLLPAMGMFLLLFINTLIGVTSFTAEIRRLHDTNRSAHFLWLLLIPIVGPIILIVLLAQKSNSAGQRFDKVTNTRKMWYKVWWIWLILVIVSVFASAGFISATSYYDTIFDQSSTGLSTTNAKNTATGSDTDDDSDDTDDDSTDDDDDTDSIKVGDSNIDIEDHQSYTTDYTSSWAGSTFAITTVDVYKTDSEYTQGSGNDKTSFNGIVKVHMNIQAGRDISTYPAQATLNTNDGQQVDADISDSDDFDGDLNSGAKTSGNVYFLLPTLDDVSDLTNIRLKWSADYDTDDYDDENSNKDFDVSLQLNQ